MTKLHPNPSKAVIDLRWENAKKIANKVKTFCEKNNYGILHEGVFYDFDAVEITDSEINLKYSKNSRLNLYDNDVDLDHGSYDTTEHWFNMILSEITLVKLVKPDVFYDWFAVEGDKLSEVTDG